MIPQTLTPSTNSQSARGTSVMPDAVHRHAGIVAGDVQFAEIALGLGQRVDHRLFLGHVDPTGITCLLVPDRSVRRLFDGVLLDVGHHDIGAGLGQRGGDAEADARAGAGDDRGLSR